MAKTSTLKVLTRKEITNIYEKCLEFLDKRGVVVNHPELLRKLDKAGAKVDFTNQLIRFPRDIVETALRTVPNGLLLASQDGRHDCVLPHPGGLFYVRNGTGAAQWGEPGTNNYRKTTLADVTEWGQLTEVLEHIDFTAFLTPTDMPGQTGDIHALKAIFENTTKHVQAQPFSFGSIKYLVELAVTIAGSGDNLRERPVMDFFCCATTPFVYKDMDGEIVLQSCRYGLPILATSLPNSGGTSPITIAGSVLIAAIEVLAILVMAQLLEPGLPVMGYSSLYTIDMATGRTTPANIESILGSVAFVQFIREAFKIPTCTLGFMPNSYIPDGEAMIQATMRGLMAAMAGCDFLLNSGRIKAGLAASSIELILENTIAGTIKRAMQGVAVNEDTLDWQDILATQPGDHFLETAHTLRHCRDAIRVRLFSNQPYEGWKAQGSKDLYARAVDEYYALKTKMKPLNLSVELKREFDRIVKHADEHLVK